MESVKIALANIQSHEMTSFTIKPGMNFILANDNNVGKSAIFKVLSVVAKAPNVNGDKIDTLIRVGTDKAYAAFVYGNKRVVAWLNRGKTPGASKLFFEIYDGEDVTRNIKAPQSLLDALGIVITPKGTILNFNDADSVQLVSRVSSESDAVFTYVMLDDKVEYVKKNLAELYRILQTDDRDVRTRLATTEDMVGQLKYQPAVDEFNESHGLLEAMVYMLDNCLPKEDLEPFPVKEQEVEYASGLVELSRALSYMESVKSLPTGIDELHNLMQLLPWLSKLADVNIVTVELEQRYKELKELICVCRAVYEMYRNIQVAEKLEREIFELEQERDEIIDELVKSSVIIECPMKGKVFYRSDKCIPFVDRPALRATKDTSV